MFRTGRTVYFIDSNKKNGGGGGIGTHGTLTRTTVFEFDGDLVALYYVMLFSAVSSNF